MSSCHEDSPEFRSGLAQLEVSNSTDSVLACCKSWVNVDVDVNLPSFGAGSYSIVGEAFEADLRDMRGKTGSCRERSLSLAT